MKELVATTIRMYLQVTTVATIHSFFNCFFIEHLQVPGWVCADRWPLEVLGGHLTSMLSLGKGLP